MTAELIVDARNSVGESPVWVASEQALYWVDIPSGCLQRWRLDGALDSWQGDEMLGCVAPLANGSWLAARESGLFRLRADEHGRLLGESVTEVSHARTGMRFNDGRCDRQGRFWAGTMQMNMGSEAVGKLYRYTTRDGLVSQLDGLLVPNGLAFSPDGKTMYLSDSHASVQLIWVFDYDTDNGTAQNRRIFVDMNAHPGRPDGAAVDADGCYWTCANDAGLVLRFTPEGKLDRSLPLPVKKPAMCAFGGPGLDTLFVTSIRPQGVDLSDQPLAGGLFALNVGVKGLEEPSFNG